MPPLLQAESCCRIGEEYPFPIVDHAAARKDALAAYAPVLGSGNA
jgi:deoxyribodipyrimidine photolyase